MKPSVGRAAALFAMVLGILWGSCDRPPTSEYDLPAYWRGAEQREVFTGPRKPSDYAGDELLLAVENEGQVRVLIRGEFPCLELHEAFVRPGAVGEYDVLVQPIDLHPDGVNACGLRFYDLRFYVGAGQEGTAVTLYYRGTDDSEHFPDPDLLGTIAADAIHVDCDHLIPCGVDTPCADEGIHSDELVDWTLGCFQLPSCDGAFCAWDGEACMMECGHTDCAVLESYPAQLDCAGG